MSTLDRAQTATLTTVVPETFDEALPASAPRATDEVDLVRRLHEQIDTERCDATMSKRHRKDTGTSCGQRAYVVTLVATSAGPLPLAWCQHHFEHGMGAASGRVVVDIRTRLTDKP